MNNIFAELSMNKKLAALGFFLAVAAAVIGDPARNENSNINLNELALEIENEKDHIDASILADWIMQKKQDYILVDIRDAEKFNEYHIPSAQNISIQKLINENFTRDVKILIYSQGGTHGSQAWFLLKAKGYRHVYFLRNGMYEWIDEILFPKISKQLFTENKSEFAKINRRTKFFGGEVELSDSLKIPPKTYRREGC